jgi:hypothetical protein
MIHLYEKNEVHLVSVIQKSVKSFNLHEDITKSEICLRFRNIKAIEDGVVVNGHAFLQSHGCRESGSLNRRLPHFYLSTLF